MRSRRSCSATIFRIRPNAFLQTNTEMAGCTLAIEDAGLTGAEIYDLYCGTGTIGLSMADQALGVWGDRHLGEGVDRVRAENLELNQIGNAAFFAGNVGQVIEELAERAGPPDVVVVDRPGRAGGEGAQADGRAGGAAARLRRATRPPSPPTSRCCASSSAWLLPRTKPVDMFPHTPHVETVSLLMRASSQVCSILTFWGRGRPPSRSSRDEHPLPRMLILRQFD